MPSGPAIIAANAENTEEAWIVLIKIEHASLAQPLCVANNPENVVSNGVTFLAGAFSVSMPDDIEGVPSVQLEIDNVDRAIVDAARAIDSPASVTLYVVLGSTPNTIEAGPFGMTLAEVRYDALKVTGTLIYEDLLNEQFPAQTFNPARYPGLF